jgi:HEAT repeat protein
MMSLALNDLLERMVLTEVVASSAQSISWIAHREAEKLADTSLVDELQGVLKTSRSKEVRRAAYFILGALGRNTSDPRCAQILVNGAAIESDKYVLSALLDSLAPIHKSPELPLEPIFQRLHDKRWHVRHSAIQALRRSHSDEAESQLLVLLATTTDPDDRVYCHATLNDIGTRRSIPALSESLSSRTRDVRMSAELAIAAIQDREASPATGALRQNA